MKTNNHPSEAGQVLVLIILSIMGVLGFAALAIDGGIIYSERRIAQNAADASAYAGAASLGQETKNYDPGALRCTEFDNVSHPWNTDTTLKQHFASKAVARAAENNFTITYRSDPASVTANDNAVWMVCGFDSHLKVTFVDVHVRITKQVSTSIMHLFYNGPAISTVDSTVRVYPPEGIATGASVVGLCSLEDGEADPNGDKLANDQIGVEIGGSSKIEINVGKVISNCELKTHGGSATDPWIVPDDIWYLTDPLDNIGQKAPFAPGTEIKKAPSETTFPYDFSQSLQTQCDLAYGSGTPTNDVVLNNKNDLVTINPGKFDQISVGNGRLILTPGLYCVYGGFSISGGGVEGALDNTKYAVYAPNVTIYMPDGDKNGFDINGGTNYMTAADPQCFQGTNPCTAVPGPKQPIKGLLLWNNTDKSSLAIKINGNGDSTFEGTIAAPYQDVTLNGNDDTKTTSFGLQLIADSVTLGGTGSLNIYYEGSRIFSSYTQLGLQR